MTTETKARIAPHSKESEMMALGCMLTNINGLNIAADELDDSDFFYTEHKIIFQVLKSAYKADKPADVHLVCEELKRIDKLKPAGGAAYITTLAQYAGTSAFIEEYVEIIKKKSILRKILCVAEKIKKAALEDPKNPDLIFKEFKYDIENIEKIQNRDEISWISEIISGTKSQIDNRPFIDKISERQSFFQTYGKPLLTGISTGFIDLDSKATPLEDTNLIIVAARPAMGKTAFAMNIASYTCFDKKMPVGVISLEMGRDQLLERLISSRTRIPGERIKRGNFDNLEFQKITDEIRNIQESPFFIIDNGCHTIQRVVSIARKLKDTKDIKLLVLDYLQLLGSGGSSDSRQYEVAEISRSLKLLAMELKIPVLCVAQLSRKVEERPDKRPLLSDLRDSGQIEQDADAILFIYRRAYYEPNDKPNEAELLLKKNRHGSEVNINLHFNKDCGIFSNLAPFNSFQAATLSPSHAPTRQPF